MSDNVNHPSHYTQGGVECIEAIKSATSNLIGIEAVCTANAIKYLWRWKEKNGVEDLNKAKWYIDYIINNSNQKTEPIDDMPCGGNCKYFENNYDEFPCNVCRGTAIPDTEEYYNRIRYYKPKDS